MGCLLADSSAASARRTACAWMLGSALALSLMPLAVDFGADGANPLVFHLGLTTGELATLCCYLTIRHRRLAGPVAGAVRRIWAVPSRRRLLLAMGALGAAANFDYAVFAWGISRVDAAVAAVLIETWPVWFIFGMTLCDRAGIATGFPAHYAPAVPRNRRYRPLTGGKGAAVAVAVGGTATVVWSASAGNTSGAAATGGALLGCGAAVAAAVLASLAWSQIVSGTAVASETAIPHSPTPSEGSLNEACVIAATIATTAVTLPAGVAAGIATGWDITGRGWASSLGAGLVLLPAAIICFRQANLSAPDLSVNALSAAGPVMALIWLAALTEIRIAQPPVFAIGAAAVVVGGAAAQRKPKKRQNACRRPPPPR